MANRAAWGLGATTVGGAATLVALMAKGRLTLDADVGRSFHELGPVTVRIGAPRDLVFEQAAAPYLGRTPAATAGHLQVLERGEDLVVAAHWSTVGFYTAQTVEAVRFERPDRIHFRHLRGPVPHAVETFELRAVGDDATDLVYTGELGIDWGPLGRLAGRYWVVPAWLGVVEPALQQLKAAAEQRAEARRRREQRRV